MKDRVKIDITKISKDTYEDLLFLFREKYGTKFFFNEWEISALKEED